MSHSSLRIGIRTGRLGQTFGERISELLAPHLGATTITLVPIEPSPWTRGAGPGPWPGESLEQALAANEIDLAVLNAKDLGPELASGIVLAAVPERVTPFDVLIARDETILDELPEGAAIGARTPVRRAQLLKYREDFRIVEVPGGLDERIRMLEAGEVDGLVVSASAVEHLGFQDRVTEIFTTEVLVPAAGQGACAVLARQRGKETLKLVHALDQAMARAELECERSFLRELSADTTMAIGAIASMDDSTIRLEAIVADPDGRKVVRDTEEGLVGDEARVGARLARRLLLEGAKRILAGTGSAAD